jgi:hypothetical protein
MTTATTIPLTSTTIPDTTPPVLIVTYPASGQTLSHRLVEFEGSTEPGCTVLAAGRYPVHVASDGSWAVVLVLNPGGNVAVFEAMDAAGNRTEARVPVNYTVASGLDAGWEVSSAEFPVRLHWQDDGETNYCTAPQSPVLPESGQPLQDGVYPIVLSKYIGDPRVLEMDVMRWISCSSQPDRCYSPFGEGNAFIDDSTTVHITLAGHSLTVVVQGFSDPASPDEGGLIEIVGDGSTFVRLVEHVNATCRWEPETHSEEGSAEGVTFVEGLGPLCQGPVGVYLSPYGWWANLEFRDGSPVLWVFWIHQMAG